jgi:hypothetical protein
MRFFSLICVLCSLHVSGQDSTGGGNNKQDTASGPNNKIVFGFALGPNFTRASTISYTQDQAAASLGQYTMSKFAVGFDAKAFLILPMGQTTYFRPELGFTLLNQRQIYDNYPQPNTELSTTYTEKLTETQISVSALLGIRLKPFSIELGPQLGLVTGAVDHSSSLTLAYNGPVYGNAMLDFKKLKMANTAVCSVLLGVTRQDIYKRFGAGLYYSFGVADYTKFYYSRQITKVNGLLLTLTMTL